MTASTVVFTDGACERNPGGRGGWGWVVDEHTFGFGSDAATTNQRMEIRAALEAVRALPRPLTVWSDSRYVVDCFERSWWRTWQRNGWLNSKKEPVKNRDLWEPFVELVATGKVSFRWVRGHSGVHLNEVADRLANAGMLGEPVAAPLDLAGLVLSAAQGAGTAGRFVVSAKWSANCKACGDRYSEGTSVTKTDVGWVHEECGAA
ncbi:ribonuclease H family protein [Nocardioides zeicaulis]|uniref:ribonuclease H n=1 Tax=Nocardioides zeicaulis TaxID=1776857 RepID=A0ABV6E789_9ACTN